MKRLRTIQVSLVALIVCFGLMSGSVIEPASAWMGDFFDGDAPGQALYEEMVIHPQAVRYGDAVYVVYQGPGLDPYLVVFEDDKDEDGDGKKEPQEPRGPYKVGDNPLTGTWNPDDTHGGPALLIDEANGVVHVFFGAHGTPMKHAQADIDKVEEPDAWTVTNWSASVDGEVRYLTSSVTYPQLIQSTDGTGTAYMFYRFDGSDRDIPKGSWLEARSDDGGANWSVATTPAISAAPASEEPSAIQWYAHFEPGEKGRIHAVATVQVSAGTPFDRSGVYYMYRDEGGVWLGPSGRSIDSSSGCEPGVELDELNVPDTQSAVVPFSPTAGPFHNQVTCAEDPNSGIAGLLYLESTDTPEEGPFQWRFAHFAESEDPGGEGEWVIETITTTDQYFDAGALEYGGDADGGFDVFVVTGGGDPLSGDPYANRGGDIEWWQPSDAGGWEYKETVAQSDVDRGVIYNDPQLVVGHEALPGGPHLMYAEWNNDAGNFVHKIYLRKVDGTTVGKEFFPVITRLDGPSRFETAVAISQQGFPLGSDFVVLASGEAFPDALTASTLAQAYSAPLLLVSSKKGVLPAVDAELKRLKGTRGTTPQVFIVGGSQAVTSAVETQVKRLGFGSKRVAGDNRYETAVEVAAEVESKRGRKPTHAYVVSGEVFADALAAAPLAATQGAPLLFANSQGLPSATKEFINDHETITKAVVAGGPVAVSDGVYEWLDDRLEVDRVAGDDRYETAAEVAVVGLEGDEDIGLAPSLSMYRFVVATGEDFADALTGGAYAARVRGPVVLTQGTELTTSTAGFLDEHAYRVMHAYIAGGEVALSRTVADDIATKLHERQYEN